MGGDVHDSLRKVLSYVGAEVVDEACVRLPITRDLVDGDGLISDQRVRAQIAAVLAALGRHRWRQLSR